MSDGEYRFYRIEEWLRGLEADINELAKRLESLESWVQEIEGRVYELQRLVGREGSHV